LRNRPRSRAEAGGAKICNLTVGDFQPREFASPAKLRDDIAAALAAGETNYPPGDGVPALRQAVQVPLLDPLLLVPAMATVTRHLGFGVTVNLAHEAPALLARRFSTLDHLTEGRIGWNIVTGYLDSAARALGGGALPRHDDRYDAADGVMGLLYDLWEGSWAADAVRADRASGVFTDPARVKTDDIKAL
jgi:alkanesulfonate monooxygenase SsuD/methylene tetrahydromethanopterin reductase-like flavin-dependent oxidoreductase (luciferase family)